MSEDRQAGFEEFVCGRSTSLLRVAYLLTGDVHAGEDLLQGVLEKMHLRWHRIRIDPLAYARRAPVNASTYRSPADPGGRPRRRLPPWIRPRRRERPAGPGPTVARVGP